MGKKRSTHSTVQHSTAGSLMLIYKYPPVCLWKPHRAALWKCNICDAGKTVGPSDPLTVFFHSFHFPLLVSCTFAVLCCAVLWVSNLTVARAILVLHWNPFTVHATQYLDISLKLDASAAASNLCGVLTLSCFL